MDFVKITKIENLKCQRYALISIAQESFEKGEYERSTTLRNIAKSLEEYQNILEVTKSSEDVLINDLIKRIEDIENNQSNFVRWSDIKKIQQTQGV